MDYKKIIKDQNLRFKILDMFNFISDERMIKIQYRIKTGRKLSLDNPKRFTEKLQWYKLNYRDKLLTQCCDKYEVRKYVEEKGLGDILNDLYAVYDNVDEIEFDKLPISFAIKVTNGSGTNIFINDKTQMNMEEVKEKLNNWMNIKNCSYGREWCYYDVKPKIIVERLLERDKNNDIPDYKFFCFDGKVYCLYTMIDYVDNHDEGKCGFYTKEFVQMPYSRQEFRPIDKELQKPKNFETMVKYAEILSKGFPHVRVDFYNISGKIVFGELTFYNGSGYSVFSPDEFDFILGEQFVLPHKVIGD